MTNLLTSQPTKSMTAPQAKIRAVVYRRVSTDDQAGPDKTSLDYQKRVAEQEAAKRGWVLVGDYVDSGISGEKFEERAALQRLMADGQARKFDVVIVYNGDRLARNFRLYTDIIDDLHHKCRVQIFDLSNPHEIMEPSRFNPDQDESLLFTHGLRGMLAQADQRQRTRRIVAGKEAAARTGRHVAGRTPYGFKASYGLHKRRIIEPDPETYWVLELLPRLIVEQNLSLREIAAQLQEKYKAPTRSRCAMWYASAVLVILKNPFYAGKIRFRSKTLNADQKYRANPDPASIIWADHEYKAPWSWELYERIQAVLVERKINPPRIFSSPNPLSGVIMCGHCGRRLVKKTCAANKHLNLSCSFYAYSRLACQPNKTSLDHLLTQEIWPHLDRIADEVARGDTSSLQRKLEAQAQEQQLPALEAHRSRLDSDFDRLPSRRGRIDRAYQLEIISDEEYRNQVAELKKEQAEIENSLVEVNSQIAALQEVGAWHARLLDFSNLWQRFRSDLARPLAEWDDWLIRLVRELVSRIYREIRVKSYWQSGPARWDFEVEFIFNN